jgi:parallel beta-helix repeat protein
MKSVFLHAIRNVRPGRFLLAVLAITLVCASAAKAAPVPPPIKITSSSCNYVILDPGVYSLETDIGPCGPGSYGIVIEASNVTVYLNGHTLNGSAVPENCDGVVGINPFLNFFGGGPSTNVNIVGPGNIENFQYGVEAVFTSNSSASFLKITSNCAQLQSNSGFYPSFGFYIDYSASNWTLLGNEVHMPVTTGAGGVDAAMIIFSGDNYIAGNSVNDSIWLFGSVNVLFGNFFSNGRSGIQLYGASNNQIIANTTDNNSGNNGIWLDAGSIGNLVTLNRSLHNTPYDMEDDSPGCGTNKWVRNNFKTANQACIH